MNAHAVIFFLSVSAALLIFPLVALGQAQGTTTGIPLDVKTFLNPDRWFEGLKRNITIPLPTSTGGTVSIPTPEKALKEVSPKLQEVNTGVREETGVDLAKFIGWFAKVLKVFFEVVVKLLEAVSKAMSSQ